ncbi:hypothetical protein SAMN05445850_4339 [Paraburkholderia tuberum]|uniref:Uncharacterized protein n=1 Tax=Paraburkholderia tuberum TaxID=157910 RepID=A0A1H1J7X5_9BURK|nr:hypothetical protein SAMN05445850_4339 [Paraburkholderia tuberum]
MALLPLNDEADCLADQHENRVGFPSVTTTQSRSPLPRERFSPLADRGLTTVSVRRRHPWRPIGKKFAKQRDRTSRRTLRRNVQFASIPDLLRRLRDGPGHNEQAYVRSSAWRSATRHRMLWSLAWVDAIRQIQGASCAPSINEALHNCPTTVTANRSEFPSSARPGLTKAMRQSQPIEFLSWR